MGETTREALQAHYDGNPFHAWLDLTVERATDDAVTFSVPYEERFTNPGGSVHGGVIATLIDVGSGAMVRCLHDDPADVAMATTDLSVQYLRPVTADMTVTGRLARMGSTRATVAVDVESTAPSGEDKRVAMGFASYQLLD